jgi:hypothetical protein
MSTAFSPAFNAGSNGGNPYVSAELALQITMTEAFILADAVEIQLLRREKVSDGAGGFTLSDPQELPGVQTFRLIPQSDKVPEVSTSDGRRANVEYILLALPDADLQRYDLFDWEDIRWEIAQIHMKPDYERKGDVVQYVR